MKPGRRNRREAPVAIVGGSGFIGSNLADSLLSDGEPVLVIDNLSRAGVEQNLEWLSHKHGSRLTVETVDVRDANALASALTGSKAIFHLAAQTAVTTSLVRPGEDFDINLRGTFNVLEAARQSGERIPVIFASTNKVYGSLPDIAVRPEGERYVPCDPAIRTEGIGEGRSLDFCTPYGCSKGAADQYVLDYAKSYGLPTAVLRMSCIYGPRQFGTEDQGWVAHFLLCALSGRPITIYGDGRQVRDILHISDAVAAYRAVLDRIETITGQAFNLGGGPKNALSLRMLLSEIGSLTDRALSIRYEAERTGDQPFFVADTRKMQTTLGWTAHVSWREGIRDLAEWLQRHRLEPHAEAERYVA
ncbi:MULTISPECIES: NAD-dependent epimerase/dehydratase family protein [unclassified Mesorhizobium]|uniref:NAD-dependent epimerase/dehydratase family protein n=1 Tax=unclassified Mesorhizobium TaxID=325217 RepID=UPI00112AA8EF|nr:MULTISPECIES: NAD-dependent epimerase/dehydratase family protein [unclassified Mesorhizobium]TPK51678.1 NAD-dependent epimerase/dehydratase family protein [Mesorhizobium sp. B2-5-2]TPL15531.1 NAD-dependent epimerase/dehydratase family protein [Mesorhizobium sp. B2-4-9]TPL30633.1 NAD-dependent epimerase/dehydratase family protein [Mesorhizobium sp. B2-4-7]TPL44951.1 NAD-dependent epimerase/dehydratase family protein [Mesorhizobium sp. B2-4-5]TPM76371.1 NAD-dependent epimerase/dehydratase fam